MAVVNLIGLILAAITAAESWMDLEAVKIVGKNGSRQLKAAGNRRDELLKLGLHALFLLVGVLVMASPAERVEREAFTVEAVEIAIIAASIFMIFGSLKNLADRRKLWSMPEEKPGPKLAERFDAVEAILTRKEEGEEPDDVLRE